MLNEEKTSLLDAVRLFSIEKEESEWMRNKRLEWLEKYEELALPLMERISYHRWQLFETTISAGAYCEELVNSQGLQYDWGDTP